MLWAKEEEYITKWLMFIEESGLNAPMLHMGIEGSF